MAYKHLRIDQGADYEIGFQVKSTEDSSPVDVSGWTVRGQLRSSIGAADVEAEFVFDMTNAAGGEFFGRLSAEQTGLMVADRGEYDIFADKPDGTVCLVEGRYRLNLRVTR